MTNSNSFRLAIVFTLIVVATVAASSCPSGSFDWQEENFQLVLHQGTTDRRGVENRDIIRCTGGRCDLMGRSITCVSENLDRHGNPIWGCQQQGRDTTLVSAHVECQDASRKSPAYCKRVGSCSIDVVVSEPVYVQPSVQPRIQYDVQPNSSINYLMDLSWWLAIIAIASFAGLFVYMCVYALFFDTAPSTNSQPPYSTPLAREQHRLRHRRSRTAQPRDFFTAPPPSFAPSTMATSSSLSAPPSPSSSSSAQSLGQTESSKVLATSSSLAAPPSPTRTSTSDSNRVVATSSSLSAPDDDSTTSDKVWATSSSLSSPAEA